MENKLRERVRQYCQHMNIRVAQFEKRAGLSNGYFNQVSKKPSEAKLASIASAHPTLNIDWLCTGRGEMINAINQSQETAPSLTQPSGTREALPAQDDILIAELRAQIERLQSKVDHLNQELGEKNALIKMMRQGGSNSVHNAEDSSPANVG